VVQVLVDTTLIPREVALSHAYGEKSGLGFDLELEGTPGVFVDGRRLGNWSNLELWKAVLASPTAPPRQEVPAETAAPQPAK
jgi:hypothetical protein